MDSLIHWFMTAPLPVIFFAGMILGVPLLPLFFKLLDSPTFSPYADAQRQYEKERDEYQRLIAERRAG